MRPLVNQWTQEIRTPLGHITTSTELLSGSELSTDQRDLVETILGSGTRLRALLNDILDFSKIQSKNLELEKKKISFRKVIFNVAREVANTAFSKGVDLIVHIDAETPVFIMGDAV